MTCKALGQDLVEQRVERAYIGPGFSKDWVPSPYQGWPNDENDALWKKYEGNSIPLIVTNAFNSS